MADYAISNVPRRVVYANSGVGPYAFTFEILSQTDISVYRGSTLLTLTTDYSVTINANGTGSVTLVTAGTGNITIVGAKNIQRTTDFTTGGDLFANALNDELDNQTIFVQQVAETAERGLKAPVVDPTDINMTLPSKDNRKGKVLAFDSTSGDPVAGPSLDSMVTVIEQSAYINAVGENISDVIAVADNEANIDIVAGVSSNVTTVAGSISSVNTVADDLNEPVSEIHTVGTNIANVNAVGTNIANVNSVAGNATNINAVAGNSTNINAVAGNATNINTVAGNNANINTVAGVNAAVSTVAGISANVTTVANISSAVSNVSSISSAVTGVNSNSTNINTVAGQISPTNNVGTVAGIASSVSTVASNNANVTAVAGNATNINTVAGISSNVTTVAGIAANVTTVAGISGNVTSVANNASNINQVASDTVAINAASANAATATTKAAEALASANSASASAAAASAVALGNEPVRHSVRPSLLLDFANTKTLDPRITFTRGSTGTFYDGKTVAKAEENLLQFSQEFDNAYWTKNAVTVTANATTAPDGTTTAEKISVNTNNVQHYAIRQDLSPAGSVSTLSVYVKAGEITWCLLTDIQTSGVYINLSTGAQGTVFGSASNISIVNAGNGWYRLSFTCTSASASSGWGIYAASADNTATFAGANSTDGFFVWGGQLERRSSVTAYTPTTTAPITNYIPALQTAGNNVPRFEHNPVTGESLGLEIEEQRTNLWVRSEDFTAAGWGRDGTATGTANTHIAPDGNLTADTLNCFSNGDSTYQVVNLNSGTTYTGSIYVKYVSGNTNFRVQVGGSSFSGDQSITFNAQTGALVSNPNSLSHSVTSVGNGWYRIAVTRAATASGNSYWDFNADSASQFALWGAQLEAGSFATSYIPTVASQVTRSADSASMTGTNFNSIFRTEKGTMYLDVTPALNVGFPRIVALDDGSVNNEYRIYHAAGASPQIGYRVRTGATSVADFGIGGVFTNNTQQKVAATYSVNNYTGTRNAATVNSDLSGALPVGVNRLVFGECTAIIRKFAYYTEQLTNAELQGLTTV